ncbi:MAG: hypothetical protein ACPG4T_08325 [Nannocystaceae bacterium]
MTTQTTDDPTSATDPSGTESEGETTAGPTTEEPTTEEPTTEDPTTEEPTTETGNEPMELGEIDGECGLIDAMMIESPEPFLINNSIDFGQIGFDYDALTPGGQEVFDDGNLGGSSLHSEVVSYEILARCDMAELLKTEGEISYQDDLGKKTDLLVAIDGHSVGVSVTRAYGFPPEDPYSLEQAEMLLLDKLDDIQISSANVSPEDAWTKQILHVIAYADMHVESLLTVYAQIPDEVKADTILVVSVTHGDDLFVYD